LGTTELPEGQLTDTERHLLTRLPVTCALALSLRDCGLSVVEISRRLSLPAAAVPTLLAVSGARLAALQQDSKRKERR
jgi:DNA-directed RNA polymerase specialized sigma24 family protein